MLRIYERYVVRVNEIIEEEIEGSDNSLHKLAKESR